MVTALVNLVLNAVPAWLSTHGQHHVPLWAVSRSGRPSVITDTIGTLVVLPFMTCLMCSAAIHRSQRRGELPALASPAHLPLRLDRLPATALRRSLALSALTVAVLSPLAVVALVSIAPAGLGRTAFSVYKAGLGVGLGALVTPAVAMRAMADPAAATSGDRPGPGLGRRRAERRAPA
jgi:hypothetical protein